MDANSRKILGLISEMNTRFVVPVYQRPYSWDETQCAQLWDDILATGRKKHASHFTGSIVTIQDGSISEQGVTPLLLIDGQQRITTISLLLVALARQASRAHAFSRDEIIEGGYLTNRFRTGDDHYKLTLSKNDLPRYRALVDAVEHNDETPEDEGGRLLHNLAFFERRIAALDDIDLVWHGLQRLEVVSIALSQGQDDPQVIFESMNATGKDLSVADLVRNFVLMSYPVAEQRDLYRTYWQPIERLLGTEDFDATFDDFLRSYLSVVHAPTSMDKVDAYQSFKRYVLFCGFNENDRMKNLSLKLKRFARYYVAVTRGEVEDPELAKAFRRFSQLGARVANPLLISLYDGYEHHEFAREEFLELMSCLQAYLVRRAVCDCPGSALAPFLSSLIARLDAVRSEEGDVVAAMLSMLLNEEGTPRRFPTDAEFARALATRDMIGFRHTRYLLAGMERDLSPDASAELEGRAWTVERVMPERALKDDAWRQALGADPERAYQACVNSLGNLALTSNDFDLQEGTFEEKRERVTADGFAIAEDIANAADWTPEQIQARTETLTSLAARVWPMPCVPDGAGDAFRLSKRAAATRAVTFRDLFDAGLVQMDDALVSVSPLYPGRATVTSTGKIMLANGEMFEDPTEAYGRFLTTLGWEDTGQSGWMYWRRGDGGPLLDDLRAELA